MKIAFFTTGMTRGGAERVIATLSNRLVEMDHDVIIVMLKGAKSEYRLSNRVKLIGANLEAGVKNAAAAMRFYTRTIRSENPDVVLAFTVKPNLMACAAKQWFGIKTPLVVSERANPFRRNPYWQLACNRMFCTADRIVCQSKVVSRYYESRIRSVLVVCIPNPVDLECVAERPAQKKIQYLLSVGRLCNQKRQDLAINVLAALKPKFPNLRLEVCGEGSAEKELRSMAVRLNVSHSVIFCGNVSNVMREKADAAVYLMTSDYEGFPNALIEAVASGIPIVTTDFSPGVAHELVQDGINGYVVPSGDTMELAKAVERLLNKPPSEEALKRSAEMARERFDLDAVAEQWLEVCKQAAVKSE